MSTVHAQNGTEPLTDSRRESRRALIQQVAAENRTVLNRLAAYDRGEVEGRHETEAEPRTAVSGADPRRR